MREGLAGLLECVGGGASVEVPGWRALRAKLFGAARLLLRDVAAGFRLFNVGGRGGGGIMEEAEPDGVVKDGSGILGAEKVGGAGGGMAAEALRATAAAEAGGDDESENEGTLPLGEGWAAGAFGVVWEAGSSTVGGAGATTPGVPLACVGFSSSADSVVVMVTGDLTPSPPSFSDSASRGAPS